MTPIGVFLSSPVIRISQRGLSKPLDCSHKPRWIAVVVERGPEIDAISRHSDQRIGNDFAKSRHVAVMLGLMIPDRPFDQPTPVIDARTPHLLG